MCFPLKITPPSSGLKKPVIRLKTVVFPAPLGPIRAVIEPCWISKESPSTTFSPSKLLVRLSVRRMTTRTSPKPVLSYQTLGSLYHQDNEQRSWLSYRSFSAFLAYPVPL